MTHLYIVPDWFFGIDIGLEILFGIVTLLVAFSAYRVYRISEEKSMKYFGTGFLLVSLSYFAWAAINLFALDAIDEGFREIAYSNALNFAMIGLLAHVLLLTIGLITLVYATLGAKKLGLYYLLLGLGLLVLASSYDKLITFRILSVFLLSYVVYHFFIEWRTHKTRNLLYSLLAFVFLLLSNLDFAFSVNYYQTYVIGHILEFVAYAIILKNLIATAFVRK